MREVLSIAGNTLKEGLRNKMFYILLGIAFVFVLIGRGCMSGSVNLQNHTYSPEEMVSFGTIIGFHIIIFWGMTLAGLLAMGALLADVETGIITTFISKPISRTEYLLGKFTGVLAVVLVNMTILAIGFAVLAFLKAKVFPLSLFAGLGVFILDIVLLISFIFLVSLITSRVIAMIFGILGYLFSLGIDIPVYFDGIRQNMMGSSTTSLILKVIYFALPQWGSTQFYAASFISDSFKQSMAFWPVIHTVIYIGLVWFALIFVFEKKEF